MSIEINIKALVSHIINGDGLDRCLICMQETSSGFVLIHDTITYQDEDGPVSFAEAFKTMTNIEVPEDDLMPQCVCVTCTTQLINAYNFRLSVRSCIKQWNDSFSVLEDLSHRKSSETKFICAIISKNHNLTQLANDKPKSKKKRKNQKSFGRPKSFLRTGPSCSCPDCDKEFDNPHSLSNHLQFSSLKAVCKFCGLVLPKGIEYINHLSEAHNESIYACTTCPLTFETREDFDKHQRSGHKPGLCFDCGKYFKNKDSHDYHSQSMHSLRTCRACGSQFSNRGCYKVHRSTCKDLEEIPTLPKNKLRDPAIFICNYCNKEYKFKADLKNHILWIHMKIKKFECQYCNKKMNTSAMLTEHLNVHTKEKRFTCDICGIKIHSKNALVYHRRLHTGEKPYPCLDCDQAFISASRRSDHMKRKHKIGPMFDCPTCSMHFARSYELRKHLQKSHNFDADAAYLKNCFQKNPNLK